MPIPGALKHKVITESTFLKLPYPKKVIRHNLGGVPFYYLYRDLPDIQPPNDPLRRWNLDHFLNHKYRLFLSFNGHTLLSFCPKVVSSLAKKHPLLPLKNSKKA
ncbi:MAG: hypothetical protein LVR00_04180 [Rhabdochlamydiaceae bacterium]